MEKNNKKNNHVINGIMIIFMMATQMLIITTATGCGGSYNNNYDPSAENLKSYINDAESNGYVTETKTESKKFKKNTFATTERWDDYDFTTKDTDGGIRQRRINYDCENCTWVVKEDNKDPIGIEEGSTQFIEEYGEYLNRQAKYTPESITAHLIDLSTPLELIPTTNNNIDTSTNPKAISLLLILVLSALSLSLAPFKLRNKRHTDLNH